MPEKRFLIAVFVTSCVLFLLFSFFLYQEYSYTRRSNESVIHSYEELRATRAILIDLLNMETGVRGYLLTGQPQFLQPHNEAKIWLNNEIAELKNLTKDDEPQTQAMTDKIFYEIKKYNSLLADEIHFAQRPPQLLALKKTLKKQKESMDHLRQSLEAFIQFSQGNLDIHLDKLKQKHQKFVILLTAGTLGIIGTMFLATITILSLTNRNRKSEEAARATEERFRIVMNGINDGLFDFDVANQTIYFSPAYKAMLGFDDDGLPNTLEMFNALLHPEDIENTWEIFRRYQQREIPVYVNYFRMRHKEGGWRWIMSRGIGIWDKNDNMIRLIGTHTDITEQKKREEELKELNTDLESFAYIASHDLRAPLVNLKGFAREMEHSMATIKPLWEQAKTSLPPQDTEVAQHIFEQDIPEALKFIQQSVDKMDLLTNAVLDLSRIGRREFLTDPVDVHAVASRSLNNLAYELSKKDVEVQLDKLPIILSDSMALEQILSNLLDNAVKYLDPARKGKIRISCEVLNDEIIFSIADNGRGINEQDHNKIFEIFRRARNAGEERGLGMGLAYVKTTLRKLGGSIWFDSKLNEGTVFHVRLPLRPPAYHQQEERAA
jgi:PAS domain S-box-containing protein